MEGPVAGIVGDECDIDRRHRRHIDSVAQCPVHRLAIEADDPEVVAMQMHRVTHRRHVGHGEPDAVATARAQLVCTVDPSVIAGHAAGPFARAFAKGENRKGAALGRYVEYDIESMRNYVADAGVG